MSVYRERHPKSDTALISRAYAAAERAHTGQFRNSGEAYINHPVSVAGILAGLGMDDVTIAAALLHDAVEDTPLTIDEINVEFGSVVGALVDGVTKLERVRFESRDAQQAATSRKIIISMARDSRVLLNKPAARLHNMRTFAARPS